MSQSAINIGFKIQSDVKGGHVMLWPRARLTNLLICIYIHKGFLSSWILQSN